MIRLRARSAFFVLSGACYVAWLLPVAGPSHAQEPYPTIGHLRFLARAEVRLPEIAIARDPFAGEPGRLAIDVRPSDARKSSEESPDLVGPQSSDVVPMAGPEVPDIGGDVAALAPARPPEPDDFILKATIVGRRAVAYVQDRAMLEIVRVGDRLGSRTIARIDARGVGFTDGSGLELSTNARRLPADPARPARHERALTAEDLRRALAPLRVRDASERPAAAAPEGERPAPAAPDFPTPAPLPTIDERGREAGVAPTPDASAPTPYAVPGIDR